MKKLLSFIMAMIIIFTLGACSKKGNDNKEIVGTKNPQQEIEQPKKENSILSIKKGNKTVTIGDSKDAVIKELGEPEEVREFSMHYDGITVYLKDTVNMITVKGEEFKGYNDSKIGMSVEKFKSEVEAEDYFVEEQKDIGFFRMTFCIDKDGEIIKNPKQTDSTSAPYLYIITSNNYNSEATITHIQLKDNTVD
ncbi:MAG: hypothetical protein PHE51_02565 [Eubacteriales bacterium]|nr:hypothetical protein [Eubacteriales bacterium]